MRVNHLSPSRAGLSLIELLIAVSMMAILVVTAVMMWDQYIDEARVVSTKNRMDAIRKALETWKADNQRLYPSNDLAPLLGRYLPGDEMDGWGNDFVIDRFFLRVLSRGANSVLETPVPGHPESMALGEGGDDYILDAQENGRLVVLSGAGPSDLLVMNPDGSGVTTLLQGIQGGDVSPGGGLVVHTNGSDFFRELLTEDNALGEIDPYTGDVTSAVGMPWLTSSLPAGGAFGSLSLAPDGVHVAFLQNAPGETRLHVGEVVDPALGTGAETHTVIEVPTGAPLTHGHRTRISWDRSGGRLYLNGNDGSDDYILQLGSSPGSRLTTPVYGKSAGVNFESIEACATRDRLTFVRDGVTVIAGSTGATVTSRNVSGVGDAISRFNRQGSAVVVAGSDDSVWIWWASIPDIPGANPYRVLAPGSVGAIRDLRWR